MSHNLAFLMHSKIVHMCSSSTKHLPSLKFCKSHTLQFLCKNYCKSCDVPLPRKRCFLFSQSCISVILEKSPGRLEYTLVKEGRSKANPFVASQIWPSLRKYSMKSLKWLFTKGQKTIAEKYEIWSMSNSRTKPPVHLFLNSKIRLSSHITCKEKSVSLRLLFDCCTFFFCNFLLKKPWKY